MEKEGVNKLRTDQSGKLDTNQNIDLNLLTSRLDQLEEKASEIELDLKKSKFDLVTLLGVFVGLITYLGLEIQVFKSISNPLLIIGISLFFIASILLFILCINLVIKKIESLTWRDFNNPVYVILVMLLVVSMFFIIVGYNDYFLQNGSRIFVAS